jgi:hypothetical protein
VDLGYRDQNLANIPQRHLSAASGPLSAANYSTNPICMIPNHSITPAAFSYCDNDAGYPIGDDARYVSTDPDAHPSFTSRIIKGPVDDMTSVGSTRVLTPSESDQAVAMLCKWEGCKYDGFFKREVDLVRHVRCVHISPRSYSCPAGGCRKSFNRKDNRDAHFRRLHESGEANIRKKGRSKRSDKRENRHNY